MRKFLAILFVSLLIVPTAAWVLGLDFGININRLGLKFPQPYGRAFLEKEYYRAFDQYFDDSFSMRGPLMLAKNWIDFKLFQTTDTTDVHIGRDGWLYGRKSITDYSRAGHAKEADMERLALQLHAVEKIVTASGRHFLFIVAPAKAIVYPEFLGLAPEFLNGGRSQLDLFLGHLDRHPLKSYVPLDEVMKAAKSSQVLLYDKVHAHWNGLGALVAAECIYHRIHGDTARPGALDYIANRDDGVGDLSARLMGLSAETAETPFRLICRPVSCTATCSSRNFPPTCCGCLNSLMSSRPTGSHPFSTRKIGLRMNTYCWKALKPSCRRSTSTLTESIPCWSPKRKAPEGLHWI